MVTLTGLHVVSRYFSNGSPCSSVRVIHKISVIVLWRIYGNGSSDVGSSLGYHSSLWEQHILLIFFFKQHFYFYFYLAYIRVNRMLDVSIWDLELIIPMPHQCLIYHTLLYTRFFISSSFVRKLYWDSQMAKKLSVLSPGKLRNL